MEAKALVPVAGRYASAVPMVVSVGRVGYWRLALGRQRRGTAAPSLSALALGLADEAERCGSGSGVGQAGRAG